MKRRQLSPGVCWRRRAGAGTALRYLLVLTAQEWFVRGAAFPLQPLADAASSAFPGGFQSLLRTRSRPFAALTLRSARSVRISLCIYTEAYPE